MNQDKYTNLKKILAYIKYSTRRARVDQSLFFGAKNSETSS